MFNIAYRGPEQNSLISDEELVEYVLRKAWTQSIVSVDTETVSLKNRACIGIGLGIGDNEGIYLQVLPSRSPYIPAVMELLSSPSITKIFHNALFDIGVLNSLAEQERLPIPSLKNIHDTSIMAQVSGYPTTLQILGEDLLHYQDMFSIQQLLAEHTAINMLEVPYPKVALKCLNDVRATWNLYHYLSNWPNRMVRECYEVDKDLIPVIREMEPKGLKLNQTRLREHEEELKQEVLFYKDICEGQYGFSPGSNQQVGYILALRGNILPLTKARKRKQLKTDEITLEQLTDPLAQIVLNYRKAVKLLGTYIQPWLGKDYAHTHFRIDLATGRFASFDRNLQNLPVKVRDIFTPDNDMFTWFDFNQIEMRIFAFISQDPVMLRVYREGKDIHWITQQALFPGSKKEDTFLRLIAKTFNYAMIFNASVLTLARHTKLPLKTCEIYRKKWLALYHVAYNWMIKTMVGEGAYTETLFGRRMLLPLDIETSPDHVAKCRLNYPPQGTAADIIKRAILQVSNRDLRLQVHDELLFDGYTEIPESIAYIHPDIIVPFEVKRGPVWVK